MSESMREQLEAAFEGADNEEEQEAGGSAEDSQEPLGSAAEGQATEGEELGGQEGGEEPTGGEAEPGLPEGEQLPVQAAPEGDVEPLSDDTPAPVSWKPGVREHWGALPPEVKAEIQRRESDITRTLNDTANHRKLAQEYYNTIAPYQQYIQAAGSTPSQAITNLMQTATQLTTGSPSMRAQVVKNIIEEYGVDIGMLDTILSGEKVPDDPNAPLLHAIDERLAPINDFMGGVQQQRDAQQHEVNTEATEELTAFQQSHSEFYEDLREDMADLLEMAANRGRTMTMEQAYEKAAGVHPEIGPILAQRAAAEAGSLSVSAADKKRAAASSIRGAANSGQQGAGQGGEASIRDTMSQLWDDSGAGVEH